MHKVSGVSEDVREKFVSAATHSVFVRMILMQRIELAIRFAQNDFSETLNDMCDKYRQIYKI